MNKSEISNQLLAKDLYIWVNKWVSEEFTDLIIGVLATIDKDNFPHTRTIAIRELKKDSILFFTQNVSRKVNHIRNNNFVSLTIILPNTGRQITFFGKALPLSDDENERYWNSYDNESKIRFMVYGGKSGEIITENFDLDNKLKDAMKKYDKIPPNRPAAYVGYRIDPEEIRMYQLNDDRISDCYVINRGNNDWTLEKVIP